MESLPLTPPAAAGLKFTETVTDCVGAKITFAGLLALNPLPVADTLEMVTFVLPLFIKVTSCAVDVPTVTLLKFTLEALADSCPVEEEEVVPIHPAFPSIATRATVITAIQAFAGMISQTR